jgi:hypothetical protein
VPRNIFRKFEDCTEGGWQRFPDVVSTSDTLGSVTNGLALLALMHSIDNKAVLSFVQNTVRLCWFLTILIRCYIISTLAAFHKYICDCMPVLINRILRTYPLVFVCFFGRLGYSFTPLLCIPLRSLIMRLILATSYGNCKFR